MAISLVFNLVVGMVFAYFLLALIASGVQEVIASIFSWRGTYLSKGIDVIIDNDPHATWHWSSFKEFWIAHLTRSAPPTAADRLKARIGSQPADPQQAALLKVLSVHSHPLVQSSPTTLPSYVSSRNFALALLETLRDGSQTPLFTQAAQTISNLPPGDLKRTLTLFVQAAAGDEDKLRAYIEHWFDDAMDRLSGIYKRMSQFMLLFLGIIIAVALNVDSARLARTLSQEPDVLNAIVADSTAWAQQKDVLTALDDACGQAQGLGKAIGPVAAAVTCFGNKNFPVGWGNNSFDYWTIPGWIVTALAIGLGAPFWFSLIQQLTNLRNAGPAPQRADGSSTP